jgi:two-component system CheB/CheR fusion protein
VLKDLVYREKEVPSKDGRFFTVRIAPYRTLENVIDGVVITFVDITLIKNLKAEHRVAAVVKDSNDAVTVQDFLGNITAWNKGAEAMYGYREAEALNMNIKELIPPGESEPELKFVQQIKAGLEVKPFRAKRKTKDGRILEVWLTVTRLDDDAGNPIEIATTERDLAWLAKI